MKSRAIHSAANTAASRAASTCAASCACSSSTTAGTAHTKAMASAPRLMASASGFALLAPLSPT
jgi:hypothetical protein